MQENKLKVKKIITGDYIYTPMMQYDSRYIHFFISLLCFCALCIDIHIDQQRASMTYVCFAWLTAL